MSELKRTNDASEQVHRKEGDNNSHIAAEAHKLLSQMSQKDKPLSNDPADKHLPKVHLHDHTSDSNSHASPRPSSEKPLGQEKDSHTTDAQRATKVEEKVKPHDLNGNENKKDLPGNSFSLPKVIEGKTTSNGMPQNEWEKTKGRTSEK